MSRTSIRLPDKRANGQVGGDEVKRRGKTPNSLRILRYRHEGPYRKNMSLRTRLILVVEADGAIGAKIIGVSRFGRM